MCELMGINAGQPIVADFSLREFALRDEANLDGWGIAWYPDQSAAVIKEPLPWRKSPHTGFLENYSLLSRIYIAHVRHRTVGGPATHADTHPFVREANGRDYVFAHNGTLDQLSEYGTLDRFQPVGGTDSESAFCQLLERIARRGELNEFEDFQWLQKQLSELNEHGKLNCLLSDGRALFGYYDQNGHKALFWRSLELPRCRTEQLRDSELKVSIEGNSKVSAVLVASHPLGEGPWTAFHPGQLLVARNGAQVHLMR